MLALIAGLYKSKQVAFFFLFGTRVFFKYFWQSWLLVEASGVEWASGYLCHVIEGMMRTALFPRHFTLVRAFSFSRTIRSNRGTIQIIERSSLEALIGRNFPDSSLGRGSCSGHPTASVSCLTLWLDIHVLKDSDWDAALSSEAFASQHRHINQK